MTSTEPKKATATISHSLRVAFSLSMIADIMIAKKGDILLSTLASAMVIWSIAQKFSITPRVPYTDLRIRFGQLSLRI